MGSTCNRPIRVLHAVGHMTRAGIETWLMHVLRHIDRDRFQMDFLTRTAQKAIYDDEIAALGSRVLPCVSFCFPHRYSHRQYRRILRDSGPYDVVHSHCQHYSGWVLRVACEAGVPVRIAHTHSDTVALYSHSGMLHRAYYQTMKRWVSRYATHGIAASGKAAVALFGTGWRSDPRWQVLRCGVDLSPFLAPVDRAGVRAELGIPEDAPVVGHVGRFEAVKNHRLILDIAAKMAIAGPDTRFLLVGDGPLRAETERRAVGLGLADRIVFTGIRPDVPRLMRGAMDAFMLPSLREGLPLVLVEAQAAGLPCVFSDLVAEEADIVHRLIHRVPVTASPSTWATTIEGSLANGTGGRRAALSEVMRSPFEIQRHVEALTTLYAAALPRRAAA